MDTKSVGDLKQLLVELQGEVNEAHEVSIHSCLFRSKHFFSTSLSYVLGNIAVTMCVFYISNKRLTITLHKSNMLHVPEVAPYRVKSEAEH